MGNTKKITRLVQIRMCEQLHGSMGEACRKEAVGKGKFYTISEFIRDAIKEKVSKSLTKRVKRLG
ncbi:MAG: hypothetical protein GWN93_26960 [Deltaproteobacteria bacterium]|nr:hypothetical protein [Deltaproteobacteria bacterium]